MGHLQKTERINELESDQSEANDVCDYLLVYLNSDKFRSGDALDGYVNVDDVRRYIMRIKSRLM